MQKEQAEKIGRKTKKTVGGFEGASAKCERNAISQPLGIRKRNDHVREERKGSNAHDNECV